MEFFLYIATMKERSVKGVDGQEDEMGRVRGR